MGWWKVRRGTHLAIHVEDAVAVIDANGCLRRQPRGDPAVPDVQYREVACEEEQQLEQVEADE